MENVHIRVTAVLKEIVSASHFVSLSLTSKYTVFQARSRDEIYY